MFGAEYFSNLHRSALNILKQAGVPEKLQKKYMARINHELPLPSDEDIYLNSLESPFLIKILGGRKQELSFFRTGRTDFTKEDSRLIMECLKKKSEDLSQGPNALEAMTKFMQGVF